MAIAREAPCQGVEGVLGLLEGPSLLLVDLSPPVRNRPDAILVGNTSALDFKGEYAMRADNEEVNLA